ncbi:hypothetical protein L195_g061510, partial [Trifolium pratense]
MRKRRRRWKVVSWVAQTVLSCGCRLAVNGCDGVRLKEQEYSQFLTH